MAVEDDGWGDLFNPPPPPPPTGPEAEEYSHEDGRPPAFRKFLDSPEGETFWLDIQGAALGSLDRGEGRFSCLGYIHHYRQKMKIRVNNTYAPWFADMLVAAHPSLLEIVERRARKKKGPF